MVSQPYSELMPAYLRVGSTKQLRQGVCMYFENYKLQLKSKLLLLNNKVIYFIQQLFTRLYCFASIIRYLGCEMIQPVSKAKLLAGSSSMDYQDSLGLEVGTDVVAVIRWSWEDMGYEMGI